MGIYYQVAVLRTGISGKEKILLRNPSQSELLMWFTQLVHETSSGCSQYYNYHSLLLVLS